MFKLDIKPLSVNQAWQGKRYKTKEYRDYEQIVYYQLPNLVIPNPPYKLYLEFGMNQSMDYDNPIKAFQDILQKRYGFDDRHILEAHIKKTPIKNKEGCYIKFKLASLE